MSYFFGGSIGLFLGFIWGWIFWRNDVRKMRDALYEQDARECERVGLPPPPRGFDSLRMHPKSDEAWKRERKKS